MPDPAIERMRAAVRETRAALSRLREEIAAMETALAGERQQAADAERRGRMARDIGDQETALVAERFSARHGARIGLLERKVAVLREEASLLESELAEMVGLLDGTERGAGGADASASASVRTPSEEAEILRSRMDRAARERAADEQLAALKRKMGR